MWQGAVDGARNDCRAPVESLLLRYNATVEHGSSVERMADSVEAEETSCGLRGVYHMPNVEGHTQTVTDPWRDIWVLYMS